MTQYPTVCAHLRGVGVGGTHETNTYESVAHERSNEFNRFKSRTPNAKIGILP